MTNPHKWLLTPMDCSVFYTRRPDVLRRAFSLITTSVRAQVLAQYLAAYGQLDGVNDWESHERSVTSEDVKRVARKYLTEGNRTVLTVVPGVNQ